MEIRESASIIANLKSHRKTKFIQQPGKGTVPHCTEEQETGQARSSSTFVNNVSAGNSQYAVVSSRPGDQPMDMSGPEPALGEICFAGFIIDLEWKDCGGENVCCFYYCLFPLNVALRAVLHRNSPLRG